MAQAKNAGLTGQGAFGMLQNPQVKRASEVGGEDLAASVTCQGASGTHSDSCILNAVQAPES